MPFVLLQLFLILCALPAVGEEVLTNFTQLRALSQEEAAKNLPVRVQATVLGVDPASPWNLFLHDGTAGCYVNLLREKNVSPPRCAPGMRVSVDGVSNPLGYYPSVGRGQVKVLGRAGLPKPIRLTADQIFLPEFDSAWVEVPAVVVGYENKDKRFTLDLEVYGLPFKAELPLSKRAEEQAAALMQRPVQLRGILGTIFNRQRQMTDRHFFVPGFDSVVPTTPQPESDSAPLIQVAQMLTGGFGPQTQIRVKGVVTQSDAKGFYLRDDSSSTMVRAARADQFAPGTVVEVCGFADVAPFRPVLRATRAVELERGQAPLALPFDFSDTNLPTLQNELVTLAADYLGREEGRTESILQCRAGQQIFEALLPKEKSQLGDLTPGDRLVLTGICELTTTHALPRVSWVDGFRIHLSGAEAVHIISRAPWWTAQRLVVALTAMSILACLGLLGIWLLRRQVNKQLAIISDTLRAEAVGKERDRMARDLHDTLEQQLSGIALQLDGLNDAIKANPAGASRSLSLARRMLRFTRLEARRSVWDLRSKTLEKEGLAAALRAMAQTATSAAGPVIEVKESGPERTLPTAVQFHLLRIGQEALANATKHSHARHIVIELERAAESTRLTVADDGQGFDVQAPDAAPGSHFGLLGMRERAAKMNGQLTITSQPGAGCTVTVTVPVEHPQSVL